MLSNTLRTLLGAGLILCTSHSAHAEEFPPTAQWSQLIEFGTYAGKTTYARSPSNLNIIYTGNTLQVTYWLYRGDKADPSKRLAGGGDTRPGEAGWTGNAQGMCYVRKSASPWWQVSHCNVSRVNVDLAPGKYVYVFYWRTKNGEKWKKMNVVHFTIKTLSGGTGRFKKSTFKYTEDLLRSTASVTVKRRKPVEYGFYNVGPAPGEKPSADKCKDWTGLFHGKKLIAVGTRESSETRCWHAYSVHQKNPGHSGGTAPQVGRLRKVNGEGDQGRHNLTGEELLATPGEWTLVAVHGKWRRMWKFKVAGGAIQVVTRQKPSFKPSHYQWVEYLEDDKWGRYWLSPTAADSQPITMK